MAFGAGFKSVVNNAGLDPLQGFDADVWVLDQGSGALNLVGRFTSIQVVIRNATEPYMEYNQRLPRHLDGDIQIGWVMERGQLDARVIEQTFGLSSLNRSLRVNRMPRFQITFQTKADELNDIGVGAGGQTGGQTNGPINLSSYLQRKSNGQLVLSMCKVDTFTMGSTAGRQVIANRWEGMAEGFDVFTTTLDGYYEGASATRVLERDARNRTITRDQLFPWDNVVGQTTTNTPNTNTTAGNELDSTTSGD